MKLKQSTALFSTLLLSSILCDAAIYISVNSATSSSALSDDVLAGIAPTGTASREGGDSDTATIELGSLTDGVSGTQDSGRSFVRSGTLDFDLGGSFDISTIYFRLVNAVVDDRLAFNATVYTSNDNGGNYSLVASVEDPFSNIAGEYATTGTLSDIGASSVTNLRFVLQNLGSYPASFSEIDVIGTAVPEPSSFALIGGLLSLGLVAVKRRIPRRQS